MSRDTDGSATRSRSTPSNLAVTLNAFLQSTARKPFALGQHDCGLILADWVKIVTGSDPCVALRGTYHDKESLAHVIGPMGLARRIDRLMRDVGLERTDSPQLGDVAVILPPKNDVPCGAIKTDFGYATVSEARLWSSRMPVRLLKAWTFP